LLRCSDQFCIDIVGMLSIGKALQGGDSRWVSSVTIHNELLRRGRQVQIEPVPYYQSSVCKPRSTPDPALICARTIVQ
jgi:hypothetical protein